MKAKMRLGTALTVLVALFACGSSESDPAGITVDVPTVFLNFADGIEISVDGNMVVIRSDGIPAHGSPYFNASHSQYEAYNGPNIQFALNPNRIAEQSYTFRIPIAPEASSNPSATPLGAIGVAVNGVPLFNQYAGPNRPLTFEINSFDQYNGHPQQTGRYHYHIEPLYLTLQAGKESIVGFLLDGFPVYGPEENGEVVTNGDLDDYHGHTGVKADYPDGTYHYHITLEDPYINGNGFFGTQGSVS